MDKVKSRDMDGSDQLSIFSTIVRVVHIVLAVQKSKR
jgi:hypothetical protein